MPNKFTDLACQGFASPYATQMILSSLADRSSDSRSTAYFWTFIMFLVNLSYAQKDINQRWFTRRCYERTRGQLFCALNYKALKRRDVMSKTPAAAKKDGDKYEEEEEEESANLGKIVNLMQYVSFVLDITWAHLPM